MGGGWERTPGLPSWNDCFRCTFSYCSGYQGPYVGGVCRQDMGRGTVRCGDGGGRGEECAGRIWGEGLSGVGTGEEGGGVCRQDMGGRGTVSRCGWDVWVGRLGRG